MEDILVPLIVFSFIALVVKMALDYAKWKRQHDRGDVGSGAGDKSLTQSELRAMIQGAVQDATEPLHAQLQALEARLDRQGQPALPEARQDLLDDWEPSEEEPSPARGSRERTS